MLWQLVRFQLLIKKATIKLCYHIHRLIKLLAFLTPIEELSDAGFGLADKSHRGSGNDR